MSNKNMFYKNLLIKFTVLVVAAAIWLPCVHLFFKPDIKDYYTDKGIPPKALMLAARHLDIWTDKQLRERELENMQKLNPEWDFMSRTYFVLALANMALRDRSFTDTACDIIDAIIDNTLAIEQEKGFHYFLMGYGRHGGWMIQPAGSQFVDGEIAIMIGARRLIKEKPQYKSILSNRTDKMIMRMQQSPILNAESYPDECWLFCNSISVAAIRINDVLDKTDHDAFLQRWIAIAKDKLADPTTGLLISAYDINGNPASSGFGPEGSTIWMVCNMLQIIDNEFAIDQYQRARKELARSFLGFGFSREWPESAVGSLDVDSGPIVPLLDASASASGLALIGAAAFDDEKFLSTLITSLNFVGFPTHSKKTLRYMASNPVGDAVMLYAMVLGPLWEEVDRRSKIETT